MLENEGSEEDWSILVDSGYQGLQRLVSATLPHKQRPGRVFTRAHREHNRRLAHHRIVCEQFYGRLKSKWRIMASKYRNDREGYEIIVKLCCSLTSIYFASDVTI